MKKLIYLFTFITIFACSSNDNNSNDNPVYLDGNGITIKAREWAEAGATGEINGITYTVVNETMLREMAANNEDLTKLAISKVTDTSNLFNYFVNFNQDIGNWDVSNVVGMKGMFANNNIFNQNITYWDVSKVIEIGGMFYHSSGFNQDLSLWNVNNVNHCASFDNNTPQWTLPKPNFANCNP